MQAISSFTFKVVLSLILLCFTNNSFSQKGSPKHPQAKGAQSKKPPEPVSIRLNDPIEVPGHYISAALLSNSSSGYVQVLCHDMKSMILRRFDNDFKLLSSNVINLDILPQNSQGEAFITFKGKTFWLYSSWDKDHFVERLCAREINFEKLTLMSQQTVLQLNNKLKSSIRREVSTDFRIQMSQVGDRDYRKYEFALSNNGDVLMVKYSIKEIQKNETKSNEANEICLLDNAFTVLGGGHFPMPIKGSAQVLDCQVDSNRNIFMLIKARQIKEDNKKSLNSNSVTVTSTDFHYEVLRYVNKSTKPEIVPIALENKYINSVRIMHPFDESLICAGVYSKEIGGNGDGFFLFQLNRDSAFLLPIGKGFYDFPLAGKKTIIEKFRAPQVKKNAQPHPSPTSSDIIVKNLFFHGNRSITIFGEKQRITEDVYSDKQAKSEPLKTYQYQDILLMNIDSGGLISWFKKLPKDQISKRELGEMSYDFSVKENKITLFYLDDVRNSKLQLNQTPVPFLEELGGVLIYVQIDPNGKDSKGVLLNSKITKQKLYPTHLHHVSSRLLVGTIFQENSEVFYSIDVN